MPLSRRVLFSRLWRGGHAALIGIHHKMPRVLCFGAFGPPTTVDGTSPPFRSSHILMTNYPGTKVDSLTAHATMLSPKNKKRFGLVWKYMLTAEK